MIRTPAKMGIALGLLASLAFGQSSAPATGAIRGVVFTSIPMARALSYRPRRFRSTVRLISKLKATTKVSSCSAPFLPVLTRSRRKHPESQQLKSVHVTPATASEVELEMKVQAVAESTTVTASLEPAFPFA